MPFGDEQPLFTLDADHRCGFMSADRKRLFREHRFICRKCRQRIVLVAAMRGGEIYRFHLGIIHQILVT
jgi:hypothetical protein